jgi:hypothetical protein
VFLLSLPPRVRAAAVFVGLVAVITYGLADDLAATSPPVHRAPPRTTATATIPPAYLALYRQGARSCPGLHWTVLAGIGRVESNHGRGWPPRWERTAGIVRGTENHAGAGGPMQFLAPTWARYGLGGDRWDPADAIPAAARKLCADGARQDLRRALFAYNHSWAYVDRVLAIASRYRHGG